MPAFVLRAYVVNVPGNRPFDQQSLQHVRNLLRQPAIGRQLAVKQRDALMNFSEQLLVGKPHEVRESGWNEPVRIADLKGEFGPRRRVSKRVGNVVEGSALSELAGSLAELIFVRNGTQHEPARCANLRRLKPLASRGSNID